MKQYNGEKAIISLTSWKKRINSVDKTIFSLLNFSNDYHIVLVLSYDEFTTKEKELPENIKLLVDKNIIEILWVKKNYRSFKKIIPTMHKYPNVPIISADDGCIYITNIADELYNNWINNKNNIISYAKYLIDGVEFGGSGRGMLFPPNCFKEYGIKYIENNKIIETNHDDAFYGVLAKKMNIKFKFIRKTSSQPKTFINIKSFESVGLFSTNKFNKNCIKEMISIIKV